jgi:hypothetical protein
MALHLLPPPQLGNLVQSGKQTSTNDYSHLNGKGYFDLFKTYDAETNADINAFLKKMGIEIFSKDPLPNYKFLSKDELPTGVHFPTWEEMKEKGVKNGTFFYEKISRTNGRSFNKILHDLPFDYEYSSWAYPLDDSIIYVGSRSHSSIAIPWIEVQSIVKVEGITKFFSTEGWSNYDNAQVEAIINTHLCQPEVRVYGYHIYYYDEQNYIELHSYARARDSDWAF